jgi:hypothetical protein
MYSQFHPLNQPGDKKSVFEVFWIAPVVDAAKANYVPISWQVMKKTISVCHCVGAMMGNSAQIGLRVRCLACGGLERGSLPGPRIGVRGMFEGKLLLWWPVGTVSSIEV